VAAGEITAKTVVTRRPEALAEQVHDDTLILDPVGDRYVRLNGSGGALWRSLDEPRTAGELARVLAEDAGIDETRALADVSAFLTALAERELVSLS
jgi:coenzyme PQQ synthesis protein D (PqqD)